MKTGCKQWTLTLNSDLTFALNAHFVHIVMRSFCLKLYQQGVMSLLLQFTVLTTPNNLDEIYGLW